MTNLKFSFSESEPGSVHIHPKPIFLFKFSNFQGHPENAPKHILFSNSAGKIPKIDHKIWTASAMQLKFLGFSFLNETTKWWKFQGF